MDRALASGAKGPGFKSRIARQKYLNYSNIFYAA
jgi:hypothetical protein